MASCSPIITCKDSADVLSLFYFIIFKAYFYFFFTADFLFLQLIFCRFLACVFEAQLGLSVINKRTKKAENWRCGGKEAKSVCSISFPERVGIYAVFDAR